MSSSSNRLPLIAAGTVSLLLMAFLLSVQYSFGISESSYSLGLYIWRNWTQNEDMGHGFLVVPLALFLIYTNRQKLLSLTPKPGVGGLVMLIVGLVLFWAGNQADVTFIGLVSVMIALAGTVWWMLGWEFLKELAFPISFLIFAIPFPGLDTMVALPLRYIMSNASVTVLNHIGVPTILNGTGILSAPDPTLHLHAGERFAVDVANPCSGIRSLFALMMVSALFAQFSLNQTWKRWVLFLCAFPLAVAGNLVRIVTLTLGTVLFGAEFALGKHPLTDPSWFHEAAGYLVFIVALLGMIGVGWLLNRTGAISLPDRNHEKKQSETPPHRVNLPTGEDIY